MTRPAPAAAPGRVPASQRGMRRQNLALVLGTVAEHAPVSRAGIAARTGLTRAAVSSLVDELAGHGLLAETTTGSQGRVGRPGSALELTDRGPAGLGLEVGVGHVAACVTDLRGRVRHRRQAPLGVGERAPATALARLAALARETVRDAAAGGLRPRGAVLSVPGVVSDEPGTVAHAPNLGWHHVRTGADWPPGLRPELENEANLGALAELWHGGSAAQLLHISAGAGIGAALLADGRLFRGAHGFAGELGHIPVDPYGPPCTCGSRGCLEQYAGEAAVLRAAGLSAAAGESPADADGVAALAAAARQHDPRVLTALRRAGSAFGVALSAAVNLLDPAMLVLGGAYAELGEWLLPSMRAELAARVTLHPWDRHTLTVSALGRRGPLLGAALTTVRRIVADPAAWFPEGGAATGATLT